MLRMIVFLCVVPLMSNVAFSRQVHYKAVGHLECESGPGITPPDSEIALDCVVAHEIIEYRLRHPVSSDPSLPPPSPLTCYGGTDPVYIDEGCKPYMFRLPGDSQIAGDIQLAIQQSDPCQWTVKLIYTFASGKRAGVQRYGRTYCEAYRAAWDAICVKTRDPNYGALCSGTGVCKVTAPTPCCSPQPQCPPVCAPACNSRPRCRLLFRR